MAASGRRRATARRGTPPHPASPAPSQRRAAGTPLPNPLGHADADESARARQPLADPRRRHGTARTGAPHQRRPHAGRSRPQRARAAAPRRANEPLTLAFRDYSWTEVRDRDGRVLLSGMNPGGTTQSLSRRAAASIS